MNIGIEVEFTGIPRKIVAEKLSELWNSPIDIKMRCVHDYPYEAYSVVDPEGKKWEIMRDRSISPVNTCKLPVDSETLMCELVSPVLTDCRRLYEAILIISGAGGVVNDTCGIHIHVDCPNSVKDINRVVNKFFSVQDEIPRLFNVSDYRIKKYCKPYSKCFIKLFNSSKFSSKQDILEMVYEFFRVENRKAHNNVARYYMMNLDSVYKRNTIEFRFFNSTLNLEELKSYISYTEKLVS